MLILPAKRDLAGIMVAAHGGVESKELPHALAPQAPPGDPPLTRGEVAYQHLQALTRGKIGAGFRPFAELHIVGTHVGAPFGAYVLQTLHCLAQLHVHPLLLLPPPRSLLPLSPTHLNHNLIPKNSNINSIHSLSFI